MDVWISIQFFDPTQIQDAGGTATGELWAIVKAFVEVERKGHATNYANVVSYFNEVYWDLSYRLLTKEKADKCPELCPVPFHPKTVVTWERPNGVKALTCTVGDGHEPFSLKSHWSAIAACNNFDLHMGVDEKDEATSVLAMTGLRCEQVEEIDKWWIAFQHWAKDWTEKQKSTDDLRAILKELFGQSPSADAKYEDLLNLLRAVSVGDSLRVAYHLILKQAVPVAKKGLGWPRPPVFRYEASQLCEPKIAGRFPNTTDHDTYAEHVFNAWRDAFTFANSDDQAQQTLGDELAWYLSAGERLFWPKAITKEGREFQDDCLLICGSKSPSGQDDVPAAATVCGIDKDQFHWVSSLSLLNMTYRLYSADGWAKVVGAQPSLKGLPAQDWRPEFWINSTKLLGPDYIVPPMMSNLRLVTEEHKELLFSYAQQVRAKKDKQLPIPAADVSDVVLDVSNPSAPAPPCGHILWRPAYKQMDVGSRDLQRDYTSAGSVNVYSVPIPLLDLLEEHPAAHLPEPTSPRGTEYFVSLTPQRLLLRYQPPKAGAEVSEESDLLPLDVTLEKDAGRYAVACNVRVRSLRFGDPLHEHCLTTFEYLDGKEERRVLELSIAGVDGDGQPYDEVDMSYVRQVILQALTQAPGAPAVGIGYLAARADATKHPWHVLSSADVTVMDPGGHVILYWLLPKNSTQWDSVDSATLVVYSRALPGSNITPFNMMIAPKVNADMATPVVLAPRKFFEFHLGHSCETLAIVLSYRRDRPEPVQPPLQDPNDRIDQPKGYLWRQIRSAAKGWIWMQPKDTPAQSIRLTSTAHLRPVQFMVEAQCAADGDLGPKQIHQAYSFTDAFLDAADAEQGVWGLTAGERRYELWKRAGEPHQLILGLDHQYGFRNLLTESPPQFTPKLSEPIVHPADVRERYWSGTGACKVSTETQGTMPLLSWLLRDGQYIEVYLDPGILTGLFEELDDTKLIVRRGDFLRQAYESLQELCAVPARAEHVLEVQGWSYDITATTSAWGETGKSRSPTSALKFRTSLNDKLPPPANVPVALRNVANTSLREVVKQLREWVKTFPTPVDGARARQRMLLHTISLSGHPIQKCDVVRLGMCVTRVGGREMSAEDLNHRSNKQATKLLRFRHEKKIAGLAPDLRTEANADNIDNELVPRRVDPLRETALERANKYLGNGSSSSVRELFRWVPRTSSVASPPTVGDSEAERSAALVGAGEPFSVVLRDQPRIAAADTTPADTFGANAWFYTVPVAFAPTQPWAALRDQVSTQEFIEYLLEVLESLCRGRGALLQQVVSAPPDDPSKWQGTLRTVVAAMGAASELRSQIAERLARDFLAVVEDAEPCGELNSWVGRFGSKKDSVATALGATDEEDIAADQALLARVAPLRMAVIGDRRAANTLTPLRSVICERLSRDLSPVWTAKGFAVHIIDPDSPAGHRLARAQIAKVIHPGSAKNVGTPDGVLARAAGNNSPEVAEARYALNRVLENKSPRMRWTHRVHAEWLATQLDADARKSVRCDRDQFNLGDFNVAKADRPVVFMVDMLDDATYDNEFEILHADCRAQAIDDQLTSDPLGSTQTRNALDASRMNDDARHIELVPVHHNPEWREWRRDRSAGIEKTWRHTRSFYLLPSRRPPRPAVHVDMASRESEDKRLPPTQFRTCGTSAKMKDVLDEVLKGPLQLNEPDSSDGTQTRPWNLYCDWVDQDRGAAGPEEDRLDVYLHRVCFILEGDEEALDGKLSPEQRIFAAFANNLMRVDVEAMSPGCREVAVEADTEKGAPENSGGIFETQSTLAQWYRFHRHRQPNPENNSKPATMNLASLVEELNWFLAESGKEAIPMALQTAGAPARLLPPNIAEWKLLTPPDVPKVCDVPGAPLPGQTIRYSLQIASAPQRKQSRTLDVRPAGVKQNPRSLDGRLVGAGLYVSQDPNVQKDRVRLALQLVFMCSSFKQYRVRVAAIRNARDLDLDGDPDINPAFRMEAPASWVNLGHVSMRSEAAFSSALPDKAPSSSGAGSWTLYRDLPERLRRLNARRYQQWCQDGKLFSSMNWGALFPKVPDAELARSFGFHADDLLYDSKRQAVEIRVFHYEVPMDHARPFGLDATSKPTNLFAGRRDGVPDERAEAELFGAGRLFVDSTDSAKSWGSKLLNVGPGLSEAYRQCICVEWLINGVSVLRIDGWPVYWTPVPGHEVSV